MRDKIAYWRREIPEAAGVPGAGNLLEIQRELQLPPAGGFGGTPTYSWTGEVFAGDLLGWRQPDLLEWRALHTGQSPTGPPGGRSV